MDPVEKRALQRAAVVGRVFWPGPVGLLLNGDRDRLRDTLDRLEHRELVLSRLSSSIAGEPEFIFKHILTREVAYESLPRRERAAAHAAVASWIEETSGERSREFSELLAYHYVEAYEGARADGPSLPETEDLRRRALGALLDVAGEARSRFAVDKAAAAGERALALAVEPTERIAALEELGLNARSDYRGDLSWRNLREAADLRLEHTPQDRRAIAWVCAMALENPLRWPGSMKDFPDVEEVRRYLNAGFEHVDLPEDEESIRLLTLRAFEPFGFGSRIPLAAHDRRDAYDSGIRAAELARRLGRLDLESAALDGATSALIGEGIYGHPRVRTLIDRRLEIGELTEDPWEAGDIYSMAAWNQVMVGEYLQAVRTGVLGRERAEGAVGLMSHCLNWVGAGHFLLGEWDRLLQIFGEIRGLLGDRTDDPPYFMMNIFGAAAFVHAARELAGADPLLDLLERSRKTIVIGSAIASYWLAWAVARRGEHGRAWELIEQARLADMQARPLQDQFVAELLAATERWDEAPAFLDASRTYAAEGRLLALPVHLDRLEGRAALAAGDLDAGVTLLTAARDGFEGLGAAWERARTELDLVDALLSTGDREEARTELGAAALDIERVGARIEIDRSRDLRGRLG